MTGTAPQAAPDTYAAAPQHTLAGTGTMMRLILRRDRIRLPAWVLSIVLFTVWFGSTLPDLYADAAERQVRADLYANPGLRSFTGPGYGLDDYTFGAMLAQEFLSWVGVFVALMAILLMARHTRAEEETGHAELVRALVVGRHAHTTAALIVIAGASVLIGLLTGVGLGFLGIETVTWPGSLLFGAALASIGLVFAAVTAVTAQVSQFARGAAGLAGGAFAATYFLRGAGDMAAVGGSPLSWSSPIGWAQQTRVYVDGRWWPLLLSLALTAALVAAAYVLTTRRDLGGALMEPRPGPAAASRSLSSPIGLAWRLQRTFVAWWAVGLVAFGLGYGAVAAEVERFVEEVELIDDWIGGIGGETIIDSFLALVVMLLAMTVAVFAVISALRLRGEETSGRAESVLAAATARPRWVASHLTVALAGSAALMMLSGLGLGATAGAALGDPGMTFRVFGASLVWIPAIWVTAAIGVALFGLAPRAIVLVWVLIAYSATIGMFGPLLGLPSWMLQLSPFGHVPLVPAEAVVWLPLGILTGLAATLTGLAVYGFQRRDLASPA